MKIIWDYWIISENVSKLSEGTVWRNGEKLWNGYIKVCDSYPFSYKKLVIPGIPALLQYLTHEKIPVALASSSNMKDIREMLNDTGFEKFFK